MNDLDLLYKISSSVYNGNKYQIDEFSKKLNNLAIANDLEYELYNCINNEDRFLAAKSKRKNEICRIIHILKEITKEHCFEFVLMKTYYHYDFIDDDIDCILCCNFKRFEDIATKHDIRKSKYHIREPRKIIFEYNSNEEVFLHLHENVSWNSMVFINRADLLERSVDIDLCKSKVKVPSPEDEILIYFLHSFFENFKIKMGDLLNIAIIIKNNDIDWDYIERYIVKQNLTNTFDYFVKVFKTFNNQIQGKKSNTDQRFFPHFYPLNLLVKGRFNKLIQDMKYNRNMRVVEDLFAYSMDLPFYTANIARDKGIYD